MLKQNSRLSCSYYETEGLLEIKLIGDIDHHSAKPLRSKIDELMFLHKPREIHLDFSEVEFMDSSGLGLILGRSSLAEELGGQLSVKNPTQRVEKVIKLAGLERIVPIIKDGPDAPGE